MSLHVPSTHLRIGDKLRFPLGALGSDDVYRHSWEIVSFPGHGRSVECRRLADGITRELSIYWADRYVIERRETVADDAWDARREHRTAGLARLRAERMNSARGEFWRTHGSDGESFYVTAVRGTQFVALLGPFASLYTAGLFVDDARRKATRDGFDPWCDIGYGCAKLPNGHRAGKFNADILGV